MDKNKRSNWNDFKEILDQHHITRLYHFTDRDNLESIIKNGGLYSWADCDEKGIKIPKQGGGDISRSLDRRDGLQHYVRVSFTRQHPMMYIAMNDGRISNPVVLEIDPEVIYWDDTLFADRNATRNGAQKGGTLADFKKIHFNAVTARTHFDLDESEQPFFQAEVMVNHFIPLKYITNIGNFGIPIPSQPKMLQSKIATQKDTFSIEKLEHATSLGYAYANKRLADYYGKGEHVQRNFKESIKYYQRAAELGNSEAQTIIGEVYSKGMVEYPVSWIDAVYWFEKSAQQGNLNAIRHLFFCYLNGTGIERNYDKAFSLINYYYDTSDSVILFLLGYCYENAIGTAKDYQAAYNYYLKSVHSVGGYTLAEVRLELLCKQHDIKDETFVEQYEIAEIGECGTGIYSSDGRRFLCYWGSYGEEYSVTEGTEVLCDDSFNDLYSECDGHYLEKLILPESLVRIGNNVFCASITNIECNSCNFVIENGFLLSNDKKTLYRYFGSDEVVNIPTTVIFVKGGAFSEKQIKHIHIPKSVKYIGNNPFAGIDYQFYYSWKIEDNMPFKITCESENYKIINNTLYDLKGKIIIAYWGHDKIVQVEKWTREIGKNAFFQSNIEILDLTNSQIKIVHETAFYRCFNLHSIQISKGTMLQYRSLLPTYLQDLIQEI